MTELKSTEAILFRAKLTAIQDELTKAIAKGQQFSIHELLDFGNGALSAIETSTNPAELEKARVEFIGTKNGRINQLKTLLGKAGPEEKPLFGRYFNEIKKCVEFAFEAQKAAVAKPKAAATAIDLTLPGTIPEIGRLHPLTQTVREFQQIMARFGFEVVDDRELEDERHNFDALNIPLEHPARDPLDNFYLAAACTASGKPVLMRSQTSTVQIRVMEQRKPPIRVISLGRVYRPDDIDATHHVMFHQMEGLMIGRDVTMASLKSVLRMFAAAYLGGDTEVRFRPSFFPFTEPSVEVDVRWKNGWLELGGAGMVDPNVLKEVGYDPEEYGGFAFGLGIARFCMLRHSIDDIRLFYQNDVRFLRQF